VLTFFAPTETFLTNLLNDKIQRRVKLLNGNPAPEKVAEATKEIEKLISEYHELSSQIRAKSPQYAALTQPQRLSLSEIQQQLHSSKAAPHLPKHL